MDAVGWFIFSSGAAAYLLYVLFMVLLAYNAERPGIVHIDTKRSCVQCGFGHEPDVAHICWGCSEYISDLDPDQISVESATLGKMYCGPCADKIDDEILV